MSRQVPGIHHVTAITADPQQTHRFYETTLGMYLIKQTVNYDDPSTYHLYYGDRSGTPGTVLSFFPTPAGQPGTSGRGQLLETTLAIDHGSINDWRDRITDSPGSVIGVEKRQSESVLIVQDPAGLHIGLREGSPEETAPSKAPARTDRQSVGPIRAIRLASNAPEETAETLALLGYTADGVTNGQQHFSRSNHAAPRLTIDGEIDRDGFQGIGTYHHLAFCVEDTSTQQTWRNRLEDAGYRVSPVRDRGYFSSVYFVDPGGLLFEIATADPGFSADESPAELGSILKLPPWLTDRREDIQRQLPPFNPKASEPL